MAGLALVCLAANGCAGGILESYLGQTRVVFYGLVKDQHGRPVEGATVAYRINSFSLPHLKFRQGSVKTGKDGRFTIRDGHGSGMGIKDIRLEGYEFSGRARYYEYRGYYTDCFKPDKEHPEVFTVRRKEPEAVFLYSKAYIHAELPALVKGEIWKGWDLGGGDCLGPEARNEPRLFFDLEITWEHDAERKEWTVHVKANGENAGFQLRDEKLYVAPEDGYVKEQTFTFGYSKELPVKHVYLRLRDPGMYARMDIRRAYANASCVYIEGHEYINPYGSCCLEKLEFDTTKAEARELDIQCDREAAKAIQKQYLAPRPPFEEWIKKGKAKY